MFLRISGRGRFKGASSVLNLFIQRAVKPRCLGRGFTALAVRRPSCGITPHWCYYLNVFALCNRIYWRLSPAIVGGVKYIASSRPDVNRIRRTISLSNRRPLGDRGLLANPLRVKLTSAGSSQESPPFREGSVKRNDQRHKPGILPGCQICDTQIL